MSASNSDETVEDRQSCLSQSDDRQAGLPVLHWSLATRIAFRFAFSYLVLYNFPFPLDWLPYAETTVGWYSRLWQRLVGWAGQAFFGVTAVSRVNGSGDSTFGYVSIFCVAAIAVVATLVWSILDRKRENYARLHEWLRVYVRFSLAFIMMSYGMVKILPSQYPPLTLDRLLQPFGDASPMGLLWTLMSASRAYTFFGGVSEMLGGVLLLFRRTTLLGALVTIAVMTNVVMMNFTYDVPVKILSTHLLLMAVFLVLPDLRRLLDFFVLHKPRELFDTRWKRIAGLAFRTALILFVLYTLYDTTPTGTKRSPFYGIWNVDTLVLNDVAPNPADPARWRRVIFDNPVSFALQTMDDSRTRFRLKLDEKKKTMSLVERDKPESTAALVYQRPDAGTMLLDGTFRGQRIHAVLHKAPIPSFRLTSRGFHWINEAPFNR